MLRTLGVLIACGIIFVCASNAANAASIVVGDSSLIDELDYSDTYTMGTANRPGNSTYPITVGSNAALVENVYGNPIVHWAQWWPGAVNANGSFSLNVDSTTVPSALWPGGNGNGSDTGLTQTGSTGSWYLPYGLRDRFVAQLDAVRPGTSANDDIRIGSVDSAPTGTSANGVVVRFRGNGQIWLSAGSIQTATAFNTNLTFTATTGWQNYAVEFNRTGGVNEISMYVDESLIGTVDLAIFNGGSFAGYSNSFVVNGGNSSLMWTDNFQIGSSVIPEPACGGLMLMGLAGFGLFGRRRGSR